MFLSIKESTKVGDIAILFDANIEPAILSYLLCSKMFFAREERFIYSI